MDNCDYGQRALILIEGSVRTIILVNTVRALHMAMFKFKTEDLIWYTERVPELRNITTVLFLRRCSTEQIEYIYFLNNVESRRLS